MGPRERYSPGPSLTLNGPGWPVEKKIKIHKMGIRGRLAASMQANYIFVIRLGVLILYGSKLAIFLFKEVTPLIQRRAIAQPVMIIKIEQRKFTKFRNSGGVPTKSDLFSLVWW